MKLSGGLALPDFKLYYWSFQVKAFTNWCDKDSVLPWHQIEQEIVKPHRIEDLLFAGLKPKTAHKRFGPIIGNSLQVWSIVWFAEAEAEAGLVIFKYMLLCYVSSFIFIFLHCPLSGPVLTYISLLIIPCMIVYVTNKQEP